MGGLFSKHKTPHQTVHHVHDLPELPPYGGAPIEYKTVTVNAGLDVQSHFSFMASNVTIQATNEEQYHPELAATQEQGYRMLTFVSLPGSIQKYGFSASTGRQFTLTKFHGIFRKLFQDELDQNCELKVVKSTFLNEMFTEWSGDIFLNPEAGIVDDDNDIPLGKFHILQTLQSISEEGGRLISVELSGMSEEQIEIQKQYVERRAKTPHQTIETIPEMQVAVDVFFEIPAEPSNDKYVYKIVNCPLESKYKHAFPQGHFISHYNSENEMSKYFETGWKLTDILEDYSVSHLTQMDGFRPHDTQRNNCLLLFEKPVSRKDSTVQYYEGQIVEYWVPSHKHCHHKDGEKSDWDPVINHYGKKGWQIVKFLATPDTRFDGPFQQTAYTKYYLFFQRIVINQN